jgi:hypothetical protein
MLGAENHARLSYLGDDLAMRQTLYTDPKTKKTLNIKEWGETLGYDYREMARRFKYEKPHLWFVPADKPEDLYDRVEVPRIIKTAAELRIGDRFRNIGIFGEQERFRSVSSINILLCGDIQIQYKLIYGSGYGSVRVVLGTSFEIAPNE